MSFVLRLITEVLIEFLDGIFKSTAAHNDFWHAMKGHTETHLGAQEGNFGPCQKATIVQ